MFDKSAFWPRIRRDDGKAVEAVLADPTLFDQEGTPLRGAVIEASYADADPPLLSRLQQLEVPFLIDPSAVRFLSPAYLDVKSLAELPYAPREPITPSSQVDDLVPACLKFQANRGVAAYTAPAVWSPEPGDEWSRLNLRIHERTVEAIGDLVPEKPLVAYVAPKHGAMRRPKEFVKPIADMGIGVLYLQPTKLHPARDSVEKLVAYCEFCIEAHNAGLQVIAGRVGAFGLLLQAIGVNFFDSGLGDGESFDLASRLRPKRNFGKSKGGGGNRRVSFHELLTTLMYQEAAAMLSEPGLAARFVCNLQCCRWQGWEGIGDRRREHNLRVRISEAESIAKVHSATWRIQQLKRDLDDAIGHAAVVRRVLETKEARVPRFDHLSTWKAVIERIQERASAA